MPLRVELPLFRVCRLLPMVLVLGAALTPGRFFLAMVVGEED